MQSLAGGNRGSALTAQGKQKAKTKGKKDDKPKVQCKNCKKMNHEMKDCFAKGGPKYQEKKKEKVSAAMSEA